MLNHWGAMAAAAVEVEKHLRTNMYPGSRIYLQLRIIFNRLPVLDVSYDLARTSGIRRLLWETRTRIEAGEPEPYLLVSTKPHHSSFGYMRGYVYAALVLPNPTSYGQLSRQ